MISFIIFNAENMKEALQNIIGLFGANEESFINQYTIYYIRSYIVILVIAIIGATPLLRNIVLKLKENKKINKIINILEPICIITLLVITTAYLVDNSYNPFLYFRF